MHKRSQIGEVHLTNPLLFMANEMGGEDQNDEVWEEEPVGVQEFIESKRFLNQKWNGRTGCRPKIMDIAHKLTDPKIREAMLLLGKGSGKDYISSIVHLYGIYKCLCMYNPQRYHGLAPSKIYFVNTARNDNQAKKVFFTQFKSLLVECPWFGGKYNEPGVGAVSFIKNVEAISANSQAFAWLGFNTIQWVGDEIAFFLESDADDESESRAGECWEAAFGSCKTRFPKHYKMIGITTPRYDDDFVMKKFQELQNRPEDGIAIQGATWDMNPLFTKEDFAHEMKRDPRRTMRDFGAEPSGVLESFWEDPDCLEKMVCEGCKNCPIYQKRKETTDIYACYDYDKCTENAYMGNGEWREWFYPTDLNQEFRLHYDLSKNKDRLGFSLSTVIGWTKIELDAYQIKKKILKNSEQNEDEEIDLNSIDESERFVERPLIHVPAVGWVSTKEGRDPLMLKNGEYSYAALLDKTIYTLTRRGFNVVGATFDQFQSHMVKQTLEDRGYETELISLDRNDEIPVAAKYAIIENRVKYPYSMLLCREAKYLRYTNSKKIDHIKKESKDVWDGFAGSIFSSESKAGQGGDFVVMQNYRED